MVQIKKLHIKRLRPSICTSKTDLGFGVVEGRGMGCWPLLASEAFFSSETVFKISYYLKKNLPVLFLKTFNFQINICFPFIRPLSKREIRTIFKAKTKKVSRRAYFLFFFF